MAVPFEDDAPPTGAAGADGSHVLSGVHWPAEVNEPSTVSHVRTHASHARTTVPDDSWHVWIIALLQSALTSTDDPDIRLSHVAAKHTPPVPSSHIRVVMSSCCGAPTPTSHVAPSAHTSDAS